MAEKNDLSAAKQDAPAVKEAPQHRGGREAEEAEAERHRKARVGDIELTYKEKPVEE